MSSRTDGSVPPAPGIERPGHDRGLIDVALWGLSLAILVVILLFSWATKPPLSSFNITDKIGHALAYAAFAGTLLLAAVWRPGRGPGPFPKGTVLILGGAVVLGGIAEVGQGLFFHRDASFRDLLIDGIGVLAAYAVWRLMQRRLSTEAT